MNILLYFRSVFIVNFNNGLGMIDIADDAARL